MAAAVTVAAVMDRAMAAAVTVAVVMDRAMAAAVTVAAVMDRAVRVMATETETETAIIAVTVIPRLKTPIGADWAASKRPRIQKTAGFPKWAPAPSQ